MSDLTSLVKKHKSHHDENFLSHVLSAYVSVERVRIFKCDKCTNIFANNRDYMLHKLVHIQEHVRNVRKISNFRNHDIPKPYKCPDCDASYAAQSTLDEHSILHLPFPHICDCGIGYYDKQDLKCHIKLVHGTKYKVELNLHQNLDPQEEQVVAQKKPQDKPLRNSQSKFTKGTTIKDTIKKENPKEEKGKVTLKADSINSYKPVINPRLEIRKTSDNKYECPECKRLFNHKQYVRIHYRVHTGERPYSCHLCPKKFRQRTTVTRHIKRHVNTEKIYKCKHCPKAFTFLCYRDRHEAIHSSIKAHECPYCHKGFHEQSALKRHKRTHTKEKRYCCPCCPRTFSEVSGLSLHRLCHENKREFQCEMCCKKFYTRTNLKVHMKVHTRERNFACDYCKKRFTRKSQLVVHIQKHMYFKKKF